MITRFIIIILFSIISSIICPTDCFSRNTNGDPTIIIHDTIATPGMILLRVDAFNFTGNNGQISAITLNIEVDTLLIEFVSIQNMNLPGNWLGNYNIFQNEITITYNAPFGSGFDINGSLLDIELEYTGGFDAELVLKPNCEITNVNLQTIQNVIYEDGIITQSSPVGIVMMDTLVSNFDEQFLMPVTAEGVGFDIINSIHTRIGYDTIQLEFNGIVDGVISNISVIDTNSILTINWTDLVSTIDLTTLDTLFYLNYSFIGDTIASLEFLSGSYMVNDDTIVATEFTDGQIIPLFPVVLLNSPDSAGITLGDGYYSIGDSVNAIAIPEQGFNFFNWVMEDSVVSTDSVYSFIKQPSSDTLIANYEVNTYLVDIIVTPLNGGTTAGNGTYNYGDYVTVLATPELGYEFIAWLIDNEIVSYNPVYSFYMPSNNTTLTAAFGLTIYTVTVAPNNANYGTTEGGGDYSYGDSTTIIATPFIDYNFIAWTEEGQSLSLDSTYTFMVTSDHNIIGNFQLISNCSAPIGLFAGNINETSTILYWVSSGDEQIWDLLWGETGFDTITGGNLIEGLTDTEYILENLNSGTEYDFYVRAVCDDSTTSSWSDPHTFATWFVGIKHTDNELAILYPNPSDKSIYVKMRRSGPLSITYKVINIMGITIDSGNFKGLEPHKIVVEAFPSGIYFLQISSNGHFESISFIKK